MDIIDFLEDTIRPYIENCIIRTARYHARNHKTQYSGHFNIPRDVFCLVDYLGYIAYAGHSTDRGVHFIQDHFPDNYHGLAELIWAMWRHGIVHEFKPISYHIPYNSDTVYVKWVSSNHNRKKERAQHMLPYALENEPNTVCIVSNTCQLADDMLNALEHFINDLKIDNTLFQECSRKVTDLMISRDYTEIKGKQKDNVKFAIERAWRNKGGLLDSQGNVKIWHSDSMIL